MFEHLTRNFSAALLVSSALFLTACGDEAADSSGDTTDEKPAAETSATPTLNSDANEVAMNDDAPANSGASLASPAQNGAATPNSTGALGAGSANGNAMTPSGSGDAFGNQQLKKPAANQPGLGRAANSNPAATNDTKSDLVKSAPTTPPVMSTDHLVIAEPAELDLGEIPTNDSKLGIVMLKNTGDTPMKLLDCKSSCGCTAAKCPKGTTILPGEATEIEIRMRGGAVEKDINKRVTFTIEGQPSLIVPVMAKAVSYVEASPNVVEPEKTPDGAKVTFRAKDGQAFKVTRMHPPLITEFSNESSTEHTVTIPWERWEELGSTRKITFYMDHPLCTKSMLTVKAPIKPRTPNDKNKVTPNTQADIISSSPELLISRGQTDQVLTQIEDGKLNLNYRNRSGAPLLSMALEKGNIDLAEALIDLGAGIEDMDDLGRTPIMYAAQGKDAELVYLLLDKGAKVQSADPAVGTALCWAAAFGDQDTVEALLEAGSPLETPARMTGFTPLIWAAGVGESGSVAALVESGANLEAVDYTPNAATALMHAARTGRVDNMKVLIDAGANIEAQSRAKKTPLLIAAEASGSDVNTLRLLVEAGADVQAKDERGRNALDLASNRTDPRAADVIAYLTELVGTGDEG